MGSHARSRVVFKTQGSFFQGNPAVVFAQLAQAGWLEVISDNIVLAEAAWPSIPSLND